MSSVQLMYDFPIAISAGFVLREILSVNVLSG